jgi:hypothetical protein
MRAAKHVGRLTRGGCQGLMLRPLLAIPAAIHAA